MKRELTLTNGKKIIVDFKKVKTVGEGLKKEAVIHFSKDYFIVVRESYEDVGTEFLNE